MQVDEVLQPREGLGVDGENHWLCRNTLGMEA